MTFNTCGIGGGFDCVTNQGPGPLEADCVALSNAIVAAFAQPGQSPDFAVVPQFAQEFSLGTCLWAWINENPVGGAILQACYADLTQFLGSVLNECIVAGDTGGFVIPGTFNPHEFPAGLDWTFEILHS